jgi:hypothetical protein
VNDLVFGRLGYSFSSERDGGEYLYGFSAGIGLHTRVQAVDVAVGYAYRSVRFFSGNHVLELVLGFD